MEETLTELISLEVPCDRSAPSRARKALTRAEALKPVLEDAKLIVSEFVTSAVKRSGKHEGRKIRLDVSAGRDRVVIAVTSLPDQTLATDRPRLGWGSRIVQRLARRWGAERWDGYRLWAEVPARPGT